MTDKHYILNDPESGAEVILPRYDPTIGPSVLDVTSIYGKQGVFTYDPGFASTASCTSEVTYIDGEVGVLLYRGYPIEQLAEHSSYLEVCYLLLHGELPNQSELNEFEESIRMFAVRLGWDKFDAAAHDYSSGARAAGAPLLENVPQY